MPKNVVPPVSDALELPCEPIAGKADNHARLAEEAVPSIPSAKEPDTSEVAHLGDVIHELNNLLTTIMGYAELAANSVDPKLPIYEYVANIVDAGNSARLLIEDLELQPRPLKR